MTYRLAAMALLPCCLCSFVTAAWADDYSVFGSSANQFLYNDLLQELDELDELREQAHAAAVSSPEALAQRQTAIKTSLTTMLGHVPEERTPLNAQVTGTITIPGENYKIDKIIYESRPGHRVTANVYLPTDVSGPVPGVLIACGHTEEGKATADY